ncbi:serine hydrolase domain-containing protein [Boseongicola aestuarii]|uniref:serine hydrolase domain-containing protein n=1 Tax=Boseongicola aestuarii TaxID=1470561 RepID=UPI00278C11FE|nr:serine hydrolase [Boseongicola aestuarii]
MTRRTFLASTCAAFGAPALAQTNPFSSALARAETFDQLHSLIVLQNGTSVIEARLRGPVLDRPANIKSVSKTIVATLTGIAIDKGAIPDVTATIADIAPDLLPPDADPRKADITINDLLTLRAGLERTSGANYGEWVSSPNWVANALARPLVATPGTTMLYSTGTTHILGALLARATGDSLLTLARRWLGQPLGIDIPAWTRDAQGFYLGRNEMALTRARHGALWRYDPTRWLMEQHTRRQPELDRPLLHSGHPLAMVRSGIRLRLVPRLSRVPSLRAGPRLRRPGDRRRSRPRPDNRDNLGPHPPGTLPRLLRRSPVPDRKRHHPRRNLRPPPDTITPQPPAKYAFRSNRTAHAQTPSA